MITINNKEDGQLPLGAHVKGIYLSLRFLNHITKAQLTELQSKNKKTLLKFNTVHMSERTNRARRHKTQSSSFLEALKTLLK